MTCAARSWLSSLITITRWLNPSSGPTPGSLNHGDIYLSVY